MTRIRIGLVPGLLLALALAVAACSGGDKGGGVASLGDGKATATTAAGGSSDPVQADLAFARCMRQHGVNMPDPKPEAGGRTEWQLPSGMRKDDPKFKAARQACRQYRENGGQAQRPSPQQQQEMVAFARCMRQHGINMPTRHRTAGSTCAASGSTATTRSSRRRSGPARSSGPSTSPTAASSRAAVEVANEHPGDTHAQAVARFGALGRAGHAGSRRAWALPGAARRWPLAVGARRGEPADRRAQGAPAGATSRQSGPAGNAVGVVVRTPKTPARARRAAAWTSWQLHAALRASGHQTTARAWKSSAVGHQPTARRTHRGEGAGGGDEDTA